VTISPGAHIAGNVRLGEGCFIGLGANIIEKKQLGEWSIVGAGCTVIKDIPSNCVVAGVPSRLIKTLPANWQFYGEWNETSIGERNH
jgi:acetyltransferase EpsM